MSYTIKVVTDAGKVRIRVIYNRKIYYCPTQFKIDPKQLQDGVVVNHASAKIMNHSISLKRIEIEDKIIRLINAGKDTDANLKEVITGKFKSRSFQDVTEQIIKGNKGRLSDNTLHNYRVSAKKLDAFHPGILIHDCNYPTLCSFEQYLIHERFGVNTVSKYMQMVKSILNKAADLDMIERAIFEKYKRPKTITPVPVWLTEDELTAFERIVFSLGSEAQKQAGYYFLLSCYTGYRISDSKAFKYADMVIDNMVVLRATKNNEIVSMPIYPRLRKILDYCKDQRFTLSEQNARDYVKVICSAAGIRKHVKFHTARHSFAMLLMSKGFTIDEVSRYIGDTPLVTKVYARVHNESLNKKVMDRL